MAFPDIDPAGIGNTGLIWLMVSYGFVLYQASALISEGSDLLLLIPSLAGLVGGVILPLFGAIPDGCIMLFSGLGEIDKAQESLGVGVGALAGSSIMLLSLIFSVNVFVGRVPLDENGKPDYKKKPSTDWPKSVFRSGVIVNDKVQKNALFMVMTTIPFFLIQVPALFMKGDFKEVSHKQEPWAVTGFIVTVVSFFAYLGLQVLMEENGENLDKVELNARDMLHKRKISIRTIFFHVFQRIEEKFPTQDNSAVVPRTNGTNEKESLLLPQETMIESDRDPKYKNLLRNLMKFEFDRLDVDKNNHLSREELYKLFFELNEVANCTGYVNECFEKCDFDGSGELSFEEFFKGWDAIFQREYSSLTLTERTNISSDHLFSDNLTEEDEEALEVPDDILDLDPEEQGTIIIRRAFTMLFVGTTLVVLFSDPMVDVLVEVSNRIGVPAFYVSFVLAPLASNSSEMIASIYYAAKKSEQTITVSLTTMVGAACMNNTFGLAIFMGLLTFRDLAWKFAAETLSIIAVVLVMGYFCNKSALTFVDGIIIFFLFPLSLGLVALLQAFGYD